VEAARDCNFAQTAERLGISQPAISDHIRALERNLDAELFERRRGTTVMLTPAGECLCREAKAILDQSVRLSDRTAGGKRTVCLRAFAGAHILERMLRTALPAFHRAHPNIALDISTEWPSEDFGALIERRELDLAVFTAMPARIPSDAQVLCNVPCVVVASRNLVGDEDLTAEDVSHIPFVLPLEGTPAAQWVEHALAGLGIAPDRIVGRTQFLDVQQRMVENGDAAALLFRECLESSPVRRQLRELSSATGGLQRALVMRRGEQRPEVQALATFVKSAVGNRQGGGFAA